MNADHYRLQFWQSEDGFTPLFVWFDSCSPDQKKLTESMLACLRALGLKCPYVKKLSIKNLYELKTKSGQIRIYFFIDGIEAIILEAGAKSSQRIDIENAVARMVEYWRTKHDRS